MQNDESTSTISAFAAPVAVVTTEKPKEVSVFQDLIAGGIAGSMSVIVGHPFDTIKVRLQTSSSATLSNSLSGGVGSLFRGMAAPLSTAAMVNAIIFAAYGTSSRWWDRYLPHLQEHNHDVWYKSFVCGSFAGLAQAVVICPMEHLKCRLQITGSNAQFKGPVQAAQSIFKSHGVSGLYRGIHATLWREIPAFGAYFSVYDFVKDYVNDYFDHQKGDKAEAHSWLASAFAGGVSGSFTWAMIYPIDVIKTRIQTAPMNTPASELQIFTVGRNLAAQHGWRFLFRGLGVTLIRAFPVNGIIFPVYEFTLSHLTNLD